MSVVHNIPLLLRTGWWLSRKKREWKQESQEHVQPYIDFFSKQNDGSLTRGILYKLKDYPLEALFAGNMLAMLINHGLTGRERRLISLCGAVLALGDIFCDDTKVTITHIELMLTEPHQARPHNIPEKLFLEIYKDLLIELDDKQQVLFHEALLKGFAAEQESRKLVKGQLPKDEVLRIASNKGGCSLLIYRSLIHKPLVNFEAEALWHAGAFTQLADDIFDVRWDLEKQVQTSATESSSFDELRANMQQACDKAAALLKQTHLPESNCRRFIFIFQVFRLGVNAYLKQLKRLCEGEWRPEVLLSVQEEQLKFKHFNPGNVLYVLPKAITVRY